LDELQYQAGPDLTIIDPVPYLDIITLVKAAAVLITDSGGMQKEAAFLETPCLTMRDETEWTETVDIGVNKLVGDSGLDLVSAMSGFQDADYVFNEDVRKKIKEHFGSGHAAELILDDCISWMS
jgi:UDP-GlcNAc3NAcA epimerase